MPPAPPPAYPPYREADPARLPTESPREPFLEATRPPRPAIARFDVAFPG